MFESTLVPLIACSGRDHSHGLDRAESDFEVHRVEYPRAKVLGAKTRIQYDSNMITSRSSTY